MATMQGPFLMLKPGETPPAGYYGPIAAVSTEPPPEPGVGPAPTRLEDMDYYQRLWIPQAIERGHRVELDDAKWLKVATSPDLLAWVQSTMTDLCQPDDVWTPDMPLRCADHDFGASFALGIFRATSHGGTPGPWQVRVKTTVRGETHEVNEHPGERLRWRCAHFAECGGQIDWASWDVMQRYMKAVIYWRGQGGSDLYWFIPAQ